MCAADTGMRTRAAVKAAAAAAAAGPQTVEAAAEAQVAAPLGRSVTMAECEKHCTPDDCWLVIDGAAYDVSR